MVSVMGAPSTSGRSLPPVRPLLERGHAVSTRATKILLAPAPGTSRAQRRGAGSRLRIGSRCGHLTSSAAGCAPGLVTSQDGCGVGLQREFDAHARSAARITYGAGGAAMGCRDGLHDGQAEAGPPRPRRGRRAADERLERPILKIGWEAVPVVS